LYGGQDSPATQQLDDRRLRSPELAPHLVKKAEAFASGASSLASPPPSHRQVTKSASITLPCLVVPSTPEQTCKRPVKRWPTLVQDSPDNPFLDDGNLVAPNKYGSAEEKPSLTYVYRGKRINYANPYYTAPGSRSSQVNKRCSKLTVEHPEFSPDPSCPPRRLFTTYDRKMFSHCYESDEDSDSDSDDEFSTSLGTCANIARRLF
jgi:hypothetical protein